MTRWVALLRAVNVGGRNKIAMADLRRLVESLGHADVATLLQSGNVVFSSSRRSDAQLADEISDAIESELGLDIKVLVRSGRDLAAIVDANPFPEAAGDPKKLHVAFLFNSVDPRAVERVDRAALGGDDFAVGDGVLYLRYSEGMQGSGLTRQLSEKKLGVAMTVRNWNTVTTLADMTR